VADESRKIAGHVRLVLHCAQQARLQADQLESLAAELVLASSGPIKLVLEAVPIMRGQLAHQRVDDFDNGIRASAFAEQLGDWLDRADNLAKAWATVVADLPERD